MTQHCYRKPNRSKIRHFSARDSGRCVAYARRDGANDAVLLAYILQAYGIKEISCVILRILDLLNTGFFLTAVVGLFKGIATIAKGVRYVIGGKKSKIVTTFLELILPKRWIRQLGVVFIWLGSVEAIASAIVVFITGIANNVALYTLIRGTCEADIRPYPIDPTILEIGDLGTAIRALDDALRAQLVTPPDT